MPAKLKNNPIYKTLLTIYLAAHKALIWCTWQFCRLCPVKEEKIIFSNFNGSGFADNPRYIAEECIRRKIPHELFWVCEKPGCTFPPEITVIKPNTLSFVYHMSTAGFWVDNTRKLYYFHKKKKQVYIHTWHAGPCFKKIEKDAEKYLSPKYVKYAKRDSRFIDVILSNSRWYSEIFRNRFWYHGPLLECGIPKNDLYFRDNESIRHMVRDYYQIPRDERLVLYVPTWRENRKLNVYHLDFERVLYALQTRFGGNWRFLVRLHPNVDPNDFNIHYTDRILNASPYVNVQELLAAGDAAITDYSSCGIDYIQLGRPSFLYAEDYEEMKRTKDYYFQLDRLPCPLALNNEELIANILSFSEETYMQKRRPFLDSMGYFDDGHASEAVVDYILHQPSSTDKSTSE